MDSALWCSTTEPQRLYGEWRLLRRSLLWSSFLDSLWGLKIFSLSYTPDNRKTSPYGSIRKLLWKKKKTVNVNTCVFDWLHFEKWCSEFNEFSFISEKHGIIFVCKSVTDQFSHQCLRKITEFNQTAKNLNCSHGSCLISDHKQLKQFTVLGLCLNPPFCIT